jgi:hypothetical protein
LFVPRFVRKRVTENGKIYRIATIVGIILHDARGRCQVLLLPFCAPPQCEVTRISGTLVR